jgi:peptidoglycan hydrolase-like protein with peptidoglycan-binding domain
MPGFPRDLAVLEPWELSLVRSRERRQRAGRSPIGRGRADTAIKDASPLSLSALLDARNLKTGRDLAEEQLWDLSLGRSRARRRAAELRFVPSGSRAKRISLGALAALTVGPATGIASGVAAAEPAVSSPEEQAPAEPAVSEEQAPAVSEAVARLQHALKLPVDGDFGPETEAAIRRLQARHGLTVDGIAGPETWSVVGVSGEETLTPPSSAISHSTAHTSTVADTSSTSSAGEAPSSGNAVERLQSALHMQTDGNFGPQTEAAIRRLQARHGLTVDGVVGPATWSVLGIHTEATLNPPSDALAGFGPGRSSGSSNDTAGGGESSSVVARVVAAGDEIATRPYVFGGGHGSFQSEGYDCSGSVSYALHGGGLLSSPEDSTGLESFGEAGPGKDITIYANAEHAFMVIDGKRFDTVAQQETGTRWSSSMTSTAGYVARHPAGL